ncbi:MAG: hypothetical protein ACR2OR_04775, partial [Hyphomicrobiales bacterium]
LDRSLRDGADWIKRLEAPMTLATALSSLARGFMKARRGPPPSQAEDTVSPAPSNPSATDAPASETTTS